MIKEFPYTLQPVSLIKSLVLDTSIYVVTAQAGFSGSQLDAGVLIIWNHGADYGPGITVVIYINHLISL